MSRIISLHEAASTAKKLRKQDKKIVLVHGCFDQLHQGHIDLFHHARELGVIFVGIDDDDSVREIKGKSKPILPLGKRIEAIKKKSMVDFLFVLNPKEKSASYSSFFRNLYKDTSPDFLVTANDENLSKRKRDIKELEIKLIVMKKRT